MASNKNVTVHTPKSKRDYRVLFLGYDRGSTRLIDDLLAENCEVHQTADAVPCADFDLAISFGYRHVIEADVINAMSCPIINLHISFLPYNRGAHPNFWSFYENTPSGVTIHLIDEGIDTGPILFQKRVDFAESDLTFEHTQKRLIEEIEKLFLDKVKEILSRDWILTPQVGAGTLHFKRDLPKGFRGWQSVIEDEIKRLQEVAGTSDA